MSWRCVVCATLAVLLSTSAMQADVRQIPLRLLFLSRSGDEAREQAFTEFLRKEFAAVNVKDRTEFVAGDTAGIDVVVLDWSQQERTSARDESPLGPLENWNTPIVFLGSAGLMISGPWHVIGGAG